MVQSGMPLPQWRGGCEEAFLSGLCRMSTVGGLAILFSVAALGCLPGDDSDENTGSSSSGASSSSSGASSSSSGASSSSSGATSSSSGATSSSSGASSSSSGASSSSSGASSSSSGSGGSVIGSFPQNPQGVVLVPFTVDGAERTVAIYRSPNAGANPPLFIFFHGTGGDPYSFITDMDATADADTHGFIIAAPQAVAGRVGGPQDVDHWEEGPFETGWNLSDKNPAFNDDVLLTGGIIDAAVAAYAIDSRRVYVLGMSNGAFFAPFVAFLLPQRIAGFAENSGGAIRCENRGEYGAQWMGSGTTCAALAQEAGFPNCTGALKPAEPPDGAVPRGYLVHSNDDDTVSVAWTCQLSDAMGSNATTVILSGLGHSLVPTLVTDAWNNLSGYALP